MDSNSVSYGALLVPYTRTILSFFWWTLSWQEPFFSRRDFCFSGATFVFPARLLFLWRDFFSSARLFFNGATFVSLARLFFLCATFFTGATFSSVRRDFSRWRPFVDRYYIYCGLKVRTRVVEQDG